MNHTIHTIHLSPLKISTTFLFRYLSVGKSQGIESGCQNEGTIFRLESDGSELQYLIKSEKCQMAILGTVKQIQAGLCCLFPMKVIRSRD